MNNREELAQLRAEAEALCLRLERLDAATGEEMSLREWAERMAAAGAAQCSLMRTDRGEWLACATGAVGRHAWADTPEGAMVALLEEVES